MNASHNYATLDGPRAALAAALMPAENVPLSVWAERHRRLSPEASVRPGAWRSFGYQREPFDALGPNSPYESVVLMWASQMSKTEGFLTLLANIIAENPGPALVIQPTIIMAEAFSKERLAPMLRDMPVLAGKVAPPRSRDSGSTIYHRQFRGGHCTIVGANSPAGLAARPIRFLIGDEVDRWEESAGAEGDPGSLGEARTRTFWNRKMVWSSSPTRKGHYNEQGEYVPESRIEAFWLESDQRFYFVPCPHCGTLQRLIWPRVKWPPGKPLEAEYECEHCGRAIAHHYKLEMIEAGQWISSITGEPAERGEGDRCQVSGVRGAAAGTARRRDPRLDGLAAGFHISELYSPWPKRDWGVLAAEWLKVHGDPERLRVFVNTSLAELYDEAEIRGIDEKELMARREAYPPGMLPDGVAVLTAGVDVQEDRLECSLWGWGRNDESWLIEHRTFPGNIESETPWLALDAYLLQSKPHPAGTVLGPAAVAIDASYRPDRVCPFCDARRGRRVWAIKGDDGKKPPWPRKVSRAKRGFVYVVGVHSLRSSLQARLRIVEGAGRVHFPLLPIPAAAARDADAIALQYFEQLNSEFLKTDYRRGRPVRIWERRKGRRAEAWDCAVYAQAAVYGLASHGVYVETEASRIDNLRSQNKPEPPKPGRFAVRSKYMG